MIETILAMFCIGWEANFTEVLTLHLIIFDSVKHGEGIAKKMLIKDGAVQNYNYTP